MKSYGVLISFAARLGGQLLAILIWLDPMPFQLIPPKSAAAEAFWSQSPETNYEHLKFQAFRR